MKRILIIDDDKDYRLGIMEILNLEDYETYGAENGEAGLNLIRLHLPDLILCDLEMPLMSGVEVLEEVKSDPVLRHIPFVIITGRSDVNSSEICRNSGVDHYLVKPVSIIRLLSTIARLLAVSFT